MKTFIKIIIATFIVVAGFSCDDYGQFRKEMYEKNIYIISTADFNIFQVECDLNSDKSLYNLSISSSGTTGLDKDVKVVLKEDEDVLAKYNNSNFDSIQKYANHLKHEKYEFPSYEMTLKANSEDVYGLLPFHINPEDLYDLSPDSLYFIPLSIESVSAYQVNEKKNNTLIQILPKNKFATMKTKTNYGLTGSKNENAEDVPAAIYGENKKVYPVTPNSVKMNVELLTGKAILVDVWRMSMRVTVNEDNTLLLEPFFPEQELLEIEMLPPPAGNPNFLYSNRYEEKVDPYVPDKLNQRFLMYYKYRNRNSKTAAWGKWYYITESTSRVGV